MNTVERDEKGINKQLYVRLQEKKDKIARRREVMAKFLEATKVSEEDKKRLERSEGTLAKILYSLSYPFTLACMIFGYFFVEGLLQLLFDQQEFKYYKLSFLVVAPIIYQTNKLGNLAAWFAEKVTGTPAYIMSPLSIIIALTVGFYSYYKTNPTDLTPLWILGVITWIIAPFVAGIIYRIVTHVLVVRASNVNSLHQNCAYNISGVVAGYWGKILTVDVVLGWQDGAPLDWLRELYWLPLG